MRSVRLHSSSTVALSEQAVTIAAVESLQEGDAMDVQLITSVAVITPNPAVSRGLYVDALGSLLMAEADGYLHSETSTAVRDWRLAPGSGCPGLLRNP